MRTLSWPPTVINGRARMEEGAAATRILVVQVLGDLRNNPFNEKDLSLGDLTFRTESTVRPAVASAIRRLDSLITIQSVGERTSPDGSKTITVDFLDRETRTTGSVQLG